MSSLARHADMSRHSFVVGGSLVRRRVTISCVSASQPIASYAAFSVFVLGFFVVPGNGTISGSAAPFCSRVDSNVNLPFAISLSATSA